MFLIKIFDNIKSKSILLLKKIAQLILLNVNNK